MNELQVQLFLLLFQLHLNYKSTIRNSPRTTGSKKITSYAERKMLSNVTSRTVAITIRVSSFGNLRPFS